MTTTDYLSADELADLIGCRPNQRAIMARWLDDKGWRWVADRTGLPRVSRTLHDKKMGVSTDGKPEKLASTPNLDAFASMGKIRHRSFVQASR